MLIFKMHGPAGVSITVEGLNVLQNLVDKLTKILCTNQINNIWLNFIEPIICHYDRHYNNACTTILYIFKRKKQNSQNVNSTLYDVKKRYNALCQDDYKYLNTCTKPTKSHSKQILEIFKRFEKNQRLCASRIRIKIQNSDYAD